MGLELAQAAGEAAFVVACEGELGEGVETSPPALSRGGCGDPCGIRESAPPFLPLPFLPLPLPLPLP